MSFYKLEKASLEEAQVIINKLDDEEKKDYFLKAAKTSYIPTSIFSLLIKYQKKNHVVLCQAFSEITQEIAQEIAHQNRDSVIHKKLQALIETGEDFSQVASQSLINGAHAIDVQTVALLIEQGADANYSDNSALRFALAENNTPVVNELLKHGSNSQVYDHLLNLNSGNKDNVHTITLNSLSKETMLANTI